jgi:hypothetical protein
MMQISKRLKKISPELVEYREFATRLARGEKLYFDMQNGKLGAAGSPGSKRLYHPNIGLYYGSGSSHSWTWYVKLLDILNLCNIKFIDDGDFVDSKIDSLDVLLMPGGDTFGMAEALGESGARTMLRFVSGGGLYIGSCAGAYLPLNSSKDPLFHFNFVPVKIKNLAKFLPPALQMPTKASTAYGCQFIYHPVREEVVLKPTGTPPFYNRDEVVVPLYGGPSLIPSDGAEPLAYYSGFTEKTLFLMEHALAKETLFDFLAALRYRIGEGSLYLFAPHFEHPFYPRANRIMADTIWYGMRPHQNNNGKNDSIPKVEKDPLLVKELKRQVSNARIHAMGLENKSVSWLIGHKYYEPEKIMAFIAIIWDRLPFMANIDWLIKDNHLEECVGLTKNLIGQMKNIRKGLEASEDTTEFAAKLFVDLKALNAAFLKDYFRMRQAKIIEK